MKKKSATAKVVAMIVGKGGVGKTTLTHSIATKASLSGTKVLCIDLDQYAALTNYFDVSSEELPGMIDVIKGNAEIKKTLVKISDNLHLLPSSTNNFMLDECITSLGTKDVYGQHIESLKNDYDLIIIDCPPELSPSTAAAALSADYVLAPVTNEMIGSTNDLMLSISSVLNGGKPKIAPNSLGDLDNLYQFLDSVGKQYSKAITTKLVVNKYDESSESSRKLVSELRKHKIYGKHLLDAHMPLGCSKYEDLVSLFV